MDEICGTPEEVQAVLLRIYEESLRGCLLTGSTGGLRMTKKRVWTARQGWTSQLPQEPGWYWFRDRGREHIVELVHNDTLGLLFNNSRIPRNLSAWPGEWSGPIPRPR